jgi:erythromycin esterase
MDPARRDAIAGELRARALPFKTVAPRTSFDDLAAFDKIIGDARFVALGESTHGTAEFFRMKHRLFEYLVEKRGFTVFAFEASWPAVEIIDRYVKTGEGTAAAALKVMHAVWQTEEVRDLIEWMRTYNSVPGRKQLLSFTGFDMQDSPTAAHCVIDAFKKLSASDAKIMLDHYTVRPDDDPAKLTANSLEAQKLIEARREALLQHMQAADYERVRQCGAAVDQHLQMLLTTDLASSNATRDKAMAENVKWLSDKVFPGEKIVLWAHNSHIATAPEKDGWTPMGEHLRRMLGQELRVLGFAFDRGEVLHIPFGPKGPEVGNAIAVKVPPANPLSGEAVLRAVGLPRFVVDLRALPASGLLGAWIAEPQSLRKMGWGGVSQDDPGSAHLSTAGSSTWLLPKAFDALIYIEESTATVLVK